jgi:Holliday junction DNA helicase RuvB
MPVAPQHTSPSDWNEYIGQEPAKHLLRTAAEAARRRRAPFPHTLLVGPSGVGKTTLARLAAKEAHLTPEVVQGGKLETPADLAGLGPRLRSHPLLFIDEVHAAKRAVLELLYEIMETSATETRSFFALRFPVITLIAATTNPGALPRPFVSRFAYNLTLDPYTVEQLAGIVRLHAVYLDVNITDEGALALATAAQGVPRTAINYLRVASDIAYAGGFSELRESDVTAALDALEVTPEGWTKNQVRYLNTLAYQHDGGPVSADTLATALGYDKVTLTSMIEGPLVANGLVTISGRGRRLTPAGDLVVRVQLG